jgi:hypothetical protein
LQFNVFTFEIIEDFCGKVATNGRGVIINEFIVTILVEKTGFAHSRIPNDQNFDEDRFFHLDFYVCLRVLY